MIVEGAFTILLLGQSNMAGRAPMTREDRQPSGYPVLVVNRSLTYAVKDDRAPWSSGKGDKLGPGNAMPPLLFAAGYNGPIWFVQAAVSGSPISRWTPGSSAGYLESAFALADGLPAQCGAPVRAVAWAQGENDAKTQALADVYEPKLQAVADAIQAHYPGVPLVLVQLPPYLRRPGTATVDQAIFNVAGRSNSILLVTTEGLTPISDGLHYDRDSALELGRRITDAILGAW